MAAAVASVSAAEKAPRSNSAPATASGMAMSAAAAGSASSIAPSTARFISSAAPALSPACSVRVRRGSSAVPSAMPTTPSGNW